MIITCSIKGYFIVSAIMSYFSSIVCPLPSISYEDCHMLSVSSSRGPLVRTSITTCFPPLPQVQRHAGRGSPAVQEGGRVCILQVTATAEKPPASRTPSIPSIPSTPPGQTMIGFPDFQVLVALRACFETNDRELGKPSGDTRKEFRIFQKRKGNHARPYRRISLPAGLLRRRRHRRRRENRCPS